MLGDPNKRSDYKISGYCKRVVGLSLYYLQNYMVFLEKSVKECL